MNEFTSLTSMFTAGLLAGSFACSRPQQAEQSSRDVTADVVADASAAELPDVQNDGPLNPVTEVIKRLDALDGVQDDQYTNLGLRPTNSTGVCEVMEEVRSQGCDADVRYVVKMINPSGEIVSVDCKELVLKLNLLAGISEKLPATKFLSEKQRKTQPSSVPSGNDFLGYNFVDHMITALLMGIATTSESYQQLFLDIPYSTYSGVIREMGQELGRPDFQTVNVRDAKTAYSVFENLGRKYGFNATPFAPPSNPVR